MNELGDILKNHDDALSASMRRAPEFDSRAARKSVRGRRTARTALTATASVAAVAALVTGGWWVYSGQQDPAAPVVSPSPSLASPSVSPSASASGRDAVAGPCPSRANSMTEAEADAVVAEPLTGEVWLAQPVPTSAPATIAGTDAATWAEASTWYEVGSRAEVKILAAYDFMQGVQLIEAAPDGSLTWVANPFPGGTASPADWVLDGVAKNTEQCYETLALPSEVPLVDGVVAPIAASDYGPATSVLPDPRADSFTEVGTAGGMPLVLLNNGYPLDNLTGAESSLPPFVGATYALKTPFGGFLQLEFNPLEGAEAVTGAASLVDYFDTRCGEDPGFQAHLYDDTKGDWTVVGNLDGRDVAVATAANPYAIERYAAYVDHFAGMGDTETVPAGFDEFLAAPGVVALASDDGGWWVQLNADFSPRSWC